MWNLISDVLNKEYVDYYLENDKQREVSDILKSLLGELSPREEEIIKLYYGLDDNNSRTTWSIAVHFGVNEKDIIVAYNEAMKKLRHPNRVKRLETVVLVPYNYKVTVDNPNGGEDTYFEGRVLYEEACAKFNEAIVNQTEHRDEKGWVFHRVHLYRDDELLYSES